MCLLIDISGVEAGKKAAGEVLALQKRVLAVLNEARYDVYHCKFLAIWDLLSFSSIVNKKGTYFLFL